MSPGLAWTLGSPGGELDNWSSVTPRACIADLLMASDPRLVTVSHTKQGVNSQILGSRGDAGESIRTHLEEALLLKLIREHEMATSESYESGASGPPPTA